MSLQKLLWFGLILGTLSLEAKLYTFDELRTLPASNQKDFYIYRLLEQPVTKPQANELLKQVKHLNAKLKKRLTPYIDKFAKERYCASLKPKQLLGHYSSCVKVGLSFHRATQVESALLEKIANSIQLQDPELAQIYRTIAQKSFQALIALPPKSLLETFNGVGKRFIQAHYNYPIPASTLQTLRTQPWALFKMLDKIVRSEKLDSLQKSLLTLEGSALGERSNFLLGLNAIHYGQLEQALRHFQYAAQKAKKIFEKDKALFWQYLLTRDQTLLKQLINSHEINIYTLSAYEILGQFPDNIIYSLDPKTNQTPFKIDDPFAWLKFQKTFSISAFGDNQKRRAYLMRYNTAWSEPYIAKMLYNFNDKIRYYLTPYAWYLKDLPPKRRALIYAIARQESHFIPTEVSTSFALGMMQFMPFLAKSIAKQEGMKNFQLEQMFDPKIAYRFANIHLDFLESQLHHPLYIAYAYNGGIGFTRRQILAKGYFHKGGYEPYLSLELIPNAQARRYGKRVLANYVIYSRLLGVPQRLKSLLDALR